MILSGRTPADAPGDRPSAPLAQVGYPYRVWFFFLLEAHRSLFCGESSLPMLKVDGSPRSYAGVAPVPLFSGARRKFLPHLRAGVGSCRCSAFPLCKTTPDAQRRRFRELSAISFSTGSRQPEGTCGTSYWEDMNEAGLLRTGFRPRIAHFSAGYPPDTVGGSSKAAWRVPLHHQCGHDASATVSSQTDRPRCLEVVEETEQSATPAFIRGRSRPVLAVAP